MEEVALALMLRDGYEAVTVEAIADAVGIGRTTFFRYFGSKAGVIWSAFDDTIAWLDTSLQVSDDDVEALDAVRLSIISSTRSAIYESDVWLERFKLLDANSALRADAYGHWEQWKYVIAAFIARRTQESAAAPVPMAIAGACQGIFLAELRNWQNSDENREDLLARLDDHLEKVCTALQPLLPS